MSRVLQQQGREHVVLERGRVGECWRTERWDSVRFQFPNWSLELPDYKYQGHDPEGFAHYSEILLSWRTTRGAWQFPCVGTPKSGGLAALDTGQPHL